MDNRLTEFEIRSKLYKTIVDTPQSIIKDPNYMYVLSIIGHTETPSSEVNRHIFSEILSDVFDLLTNVEWVYTIGDFALFGLSSEINDADVVIRKIADMYGITCDVTVGYVIPTFDVGCLIASKQRVHLGIHEPERPESKFGILSTKRYSIIPLLYSSDEWLMVMKPTIEESRTLTHFPDIPAIYVEEPDDEDGVPPYINDPVDKILKLLYERFDDNLISTNAEFANQIKYDVIIRHVVSTTNSFTRSPEFFELCHTVPCEELDQHVYDILIQRIDQPCPVTE